MTRARMQGRSQAATAALALVLAAALLLTGAIAGFFYAYSVSVIRGLDAAGALVALAAMQGINAEVRNAAFFPAFFLPPVFAAAGAVCLARRGERPSPLWFGLGALVYLLGGLILTLVVNVPMNERLAVTAIPDEPAAAEALRRGYADPWLAWNHVRTFFSFVALGCIGAGLAALQARRD